MEIVRINYRNIPSLPSSIACIGFFDGIHKGHQCLIKKSVEWSKQKNLASAIITFDPDPWKIFYPERECVHLTTLEDRIQIAKSMDIDIFYILTFSKGFASQSVDAFHEILHKMKIKGLVCGFDFQYASKNTGNVNTIKQQDYFPVEIIESINEDDIKISSSRIEPLIEEGKVWKANCLSGRIYSIRGHIGHGFKRGTNVLKIPTANLTLSAQYVLPAIGVYSGMVSFEDQMIPAMINVGNNPTFDNDLLTIEAHLIGFKGNLYGLSARFFFLNRIRGEQKFNSIDELRNQLLQDIETTKTEIQKNIDFVQESAKIWDKKLFIE